MYLAALERLRVKKAEEEKLSLLQTASVSVENPPPPTAPDLPAPVEEVPPPPPDLPAPVEDVPPPPPDNAASPIEEDVPPPPPDNAASSIEEEVPPPPPDDAASPIEEDVPPPPPDDAAYPIEPRSLRRISEIEYNVGMGYPKVTPKPNKKTRAYMDDILGAEHSILLAEPAANDIKFIFVTGMQKVYSKLVQTAKVKTWMLRSHSFYGVFPCANMTLALYAGGSSEIHTLAYKSGLLYDRIPVYRSNDPEDTKFYTMGGIQENHAVKKFNECFMEIMFKVPPTFAEVREAETLRLVCLDNNWITLHNCKGCEKCGDVSSIPSQSILLGDCKSIRTCIDCKTEQEKSYKVKLRRDAKKNAKPEAAGSPKSEAAGSPKPECEEELDFEKQYYRELEDQLAYHQAQYKINIFKIQDISFRLAKKQRV
jgi:hypothetical protein